MRVTSHLVAERASGGGTVLIGERVGGYGPEVGARTRVEPEMASVYSLEAVGSSMGEAVGLSMMGVAHVGSE